jgi:hypothetical protein
MQYSKKNDRLNQEGDGYANTRVCVRCGRIFNYSGFGHYYCPNCKKKDAKDFNRVRDYIYEHGIANMVEVSENTGVGVKIIEQYLREGRLEIPENSPIFIKCEMCGVDIRSGRLCPKCANSLSNAMRVEMNFDDEQIGEIPKFVGKMKFFERERE